MTTKPETSSSAQEHSHYKLPFNFGLGGVPLGNGFSIISDATAEEVLESAWTSGVRYFDTSPWYGLGLSERRFGHFLHNKERENFVLSTKVGRVLKATHNIPETMWHAPSPFEYEMDYTAAATRRSIEDSLQRLGLNSIDIVYIHDLSPDNKDLGEHWMQYFEQAKKGAIPELTRMRDEGLIKAWGLGVNTIEPILATLEVADPDIFLSATQYSLMYHEDALNRLFPAIKAHGASIVVGAPLNAGFLTGAYRYDYEGKMPDGFKQKRDRMIAIAKAHDIDLRTAALQFSSAPEEVAAVIPGASSRKQAAENVISMQTKIPEDFWAELKEEKLIAAHATVPI